MTIMRHFSTLFRNFLLNNDIGRIHQIQEEQLIELVKTLLPKRQDLELVRIGSKYDGGYLIPDIIKDIDILFSPGVANNSDFELFFANRGVKCYLADASVLGPATRHPNFHFIKKYIGNSVDENFLTMSSWIDSTNEDFQMGMLQMDIEGSEYENLLTLPEEIMRKFSVLIIEFHELYRLNQKDFFTLFNSTIKRLQNDFEIVHLHPNNAGRGSRIFNRLIPNVLEISFLRKDLFIGDGCYIKLPNPLDQPNRPDLPDLQMIFE